jgi:hypothetical protein
MARTHPDRPDRVAVQHFGQIVLVIGFPRLVRHYGPLQDERPLVIVQELRIFAEQIVHLAQLGEDLAVHPPQSWAAVLRVQPNAHHDGNLLPSAGWSQSRLEKRVQTGTGTWRFRLIDQ